MTIKEYLVILFILCAMAFAMFSVNRYYGQSVIYIETIKEKGIKEIIKPYWEGD